MSRNNNRKFPPQNTQMDQSNFSSLSIKTPETNRKMSRTNTTQINESPRQQSIQFDHSDIILNNNNPENLSVIDENLDLNLNNPRSKHLEKILENSKFLKDFVRQGLLKINSNNDCDDQFSQFRLCTLNLNYQLCKSYPALFLVPKDTPDESIRKNSKCHRQNR